MLSVYHMAGCSSKKLVFLSPLWFGLGESQASPFNNLEISSSIIHSARTSRVGSISQIRAHCHCCPDCCFIRRSVLFGLTQSLLLTSYFSVPIGIHDTVWLPLRFLVFTHWLLISAHRLAHLLQHHGFAWICFRYRHLPSETHM